MIIVGENGARWAREGDLCLIEAHGRGCFSFEYGTFSHFRVEQAAFPGLLFVARAWLIVGCHAKTPCSFERELGAQVYNDSGYLGVAAFGDGKAARLFAEQLNAFCRPRFEEGQDVTPAILKAFQEGKSWATNIGRRI